MHHATPSIYLARPFENDMLNMIGENDSKKTAVRKRAVSRMIFNNKVALTWWGAETTQRFILSHPLNCYFVGDWK